MIKILLSSGEKMDLDAIDIRGKRAIDLCPYSSPIFKTIRDCLRRRTSIHVNIQNNNKKEGVGLHSNSDETNREREAKYLTHRAISSRECIVIP